MVSEIFSTAIISSVVIMIGLALGFLLLKIQGE
uniref:Cytochrome b6-f complex subunit 7 n=1 Tax=Chondria sp. (in: red algae) TaxID=1982705 RepID=A0A1Z1MEJ1_9FLOR|nr:cytochrome b6-f complex subunit 7 [Chondria sp. (in: red algae)]